MRRREFVRLIGMAAATWPTAVGAQQPSAKLPTIGFIGPSTADADRTRRAALLERLGELGWVQDRNLKIEFLWADGVVARAGEIAAGYVQRGVSVIVVSGDAQVKAAKNATSAIPIVIAAAADPVGNGLVDSLSRPGGNVTGLSRQLTDSTGKRLELLREIVAGRRLAILFNAGNPLTRPELEMAEKTAQSMGFQTVRAEIRKSDDVQPAIEALAGKADALYVCIDPLVNTNNVRINGLAQAARLPTMHSSRDNIDAGGMISYGPDTIDLFRRAAEFVDKILRGAKPADLPVEQPTKFELVINLNMAKAIGLEIAPTVLARADQVIE
ncbi:ABC transporter substrate-binding protein [Bradyrhizobium sp. KBS0727]|uniref:ABC transporter substrate-binding protein n=1 Tax=unclassified Bradyrhizobium TaxID=2631580 RepID=UPI00110EF1CC|nr:MULTISPECIES: ABC transporter substrate-binding protein [unclassified Bradyrhizobium]QDW36090.1 ABC transporter substrate-binding protein [Bradyrhizobium sp. KBS0725]QDW42690.1 ABC transporter substrate-binding protein [Bradyrhizobium sp. KBS0727]